MSTGYQSFTKQAPPLNDRMYKSITVLLNYFTTALRNFWRNKTFSTIHILGLSIGISAALVIFLIVYYEFSYDRFEPDKERIYRVVLDASFNGTPGHSAAVPAPMGGALQNEVTGVELTVPVFAFPGDGTPKVSITQAHSDKAVVFKKQKNIVFTNSQYFQMLPYQWLAGSPSTSIQQPFSVVLTESRAQQYFPGQPAASLIGRQMVYNNDLHVTVSGIVRDLNKSTAFDGNEFISFSTISNTNLGDRFMMTVWNDWMAYNQLYIKLSEGNNPKAVDAQIQQLFKKYNPKKNDNLNTISFYLQPLRDMHFNHNYQGFGQRIADKSTLYGLLLVASFLLLLGCINFINLSTAQGAQRAREIGIRKTMGSSRRQLAAQFLVETFSITVLATFASVMITPILLQAFSGFIPEGLHFDLLQQPYVLVFLVVLVLIVSLLAGIYPAILLSRYNPVRVLKNQAFTDKGSTRSAWVRKTLTVSQFVIAQFFIIGTLLVSKQIHYSLNKDLGFRKDAIITFDAPFDTVTAHGKQLLNEIKAIPEVEMASTGFMSPADPGVAFTNIQYKGREDLKANVQLRFGDSNYLKVYGIGLASGRNLNQSANSNEILINETYAKLLGFRSPEDILGEQLQFNEKNLTIVGVMKDFHAESMHVPIGPVAFTSGDGSTFHIRLRNVESSRKQWQSAIAKVQTAFNRMHPGEDFTYTFFDNTIAKMYESEQRLSRLLMWSTGLMILISCLGLLGLVIYTTTRRTKEIGIRKVLGASVTHILSILSKDFVSLVTLAFLIAAPIAWYASHKWLEDFAYRTTISWWIFLLTAAMILIFALITLSVQTIRVAIANPVKSLRVE